MTDQPTPVHGYFAAKARDAFAKAGGDPDLSGQLAAWAEDALAAGDPHRGVLVGEDGVLLAETKYYPGAGAAYVTDVLGDLAAEDRREVLHFEVGLAAGSLRRITGRGVIYVRHSEVCQGAGRTTGARA